MMQLDLVNRAPVVLAACEVCNTVRAFNSNAEAPFPHSGAWDPCPVCQVDRFYYQIGGTVTMLIREPGFQKSPDSQSKQHHHRPHTNAFDCTDQELVDRLRSVHLANMGQGWALELFAECQARLISRIQGS